jgi:hypothetical protein
MAPAARQGDARLRHENVWEKRHTTRLAGHRRRRAADERPGAAADLVRAGKTVEAANKEGTLKLIWSGSTPAAPPARSRPRTLAKFGTTFSIKFAPGAGSMAEVGSSVLAELKANRPAAPTSISGRPPVARFADAGVFQPAD